ncbi:MAG TPA: metallophosphoesterase [Gaiellaceae bacterium]|nr:metallophosphoesterase [Gaiellaceae bacterium]
MARYAVHVSDLHRGKSADAAVDEALAALVVQLDPAVVLATGDLANRGRPHELAEARTVLERLGAPVLAVPGNHDIPYTLPARLRRPWRAFEEAFGTVAPVMRTTDLVAVGLNSVWPTRHQRGRLPRTELERMRRELAAAPAGALRLVALHHQLAGAPWRTARKWPLKHRSDVLAALEDAGAELVIGGHIHQSSAVERHEFLVVGGTPPGSVVLATAPGYGRPRPERRREAQGLHVYAWNEAELVVETRTWDGTSFAPTAERRFPRLGRVQSPVVAGEERA